MYCVCVRMLDTPNNKGAVSTTCSARTQTQHSIELQSCMANVLHAKTDTSLQLACKQVQVLGCERAVASRWHVPNTHTCMEHCRNSPVLPIPNVAMISLPTLAQRPRWVDTHFCLRMAQLVVGEQ